MKKFSLIILIIISLSATVYSLNNQGVSFTLLDTIFQLINSNYFGEVNISSITLSAREELKIFLSRKGIPFPSQEWKGACSTWDEFKEHLKKLIKKLPQIDSSTLLRIALDGWIKGLGDPYTRYLDPSQYKELEKSLSTTNYSGIGTFIELDSQANFQLTVVESIEGGPAWRAGIRAGDRIVAIDGKSTKGITLDEAIKKIRGPAGSSIILTIRRRSVGFPIDFEVTRENIEVTSVVSKKITESIGYIKIRSFGEETGQEFIDALASIDSTKGLILDLRNNGGGYVDAAQDVCSLFLPSETLIITIKDKKGKNEEVRSLARGKCIKKPLVILINHYSASASEITAAALREQIGAILVGDTTFGKGSVQSIIPLKEGGALKLTIAHYFTPKGKNINKVGIKPDIVVKMDEAMVGLEEDKQLKKALEILGKKF